MGIYAIDPLTDPRWDPFLLRSPRASIFHTRGWLEAIRRAYGYRPIVFTSAAPGEPLQSGLAFCEIKSWITGRRLVSLPFSDHCDPLTDTEADFCEIMRFVSERATVAGWRYVELRPRLPLDTPAANCGFGRDMGFWLHTIDLRMSLAKIFGRFHPDCVRRKVRRAERECLRYDMGRSDALLERFYSLLIQTRRRHGLPPQPIAWFRNLAECLGDRMQVRVASKGTTPIAAILTLTHKDTIVYKYGCSDSSFHNLGGMPWLFWRAIQEASVAGFQEFDLGRCEFSNSGLDAFKEHLGATRRQMTYFRNASSSVSWYQHTCVTAISQYLWRRLPESMLRVAGRLVYRHVG